MPLEFTTVDKADEEPTGITPAVENWSENYCWHGYDLKSRSGAFLQFGRWVRNPEIWREQVLLFYPDGSTGVYRGFGAGPGKGGPAGPLMTAEVDAPAGSWHISFRGPVVRTSPGDLLHRRQSDIYPEEVSFDLTLADTTPVLRYPETKGESWGSTHYEAAGTADGTITTPVGRHSLAGGFAYRDHSRGPRNLSHHQGSIWMQGLLPDGAMFCIYEILQERDGVEYRPLAEATLVTKDGPHEAKLTTPVPRLDPGAEDPTEGYTVVFEADGREIVVEATPLTSMPFSLSDRFDWTFGWSDPAIFGLEQPMELLIDGVKLDGYCERTTRWTGATKG